MIYVWKVGVTRPVKTLSGIPQVPCWLHALIIPQLRAFVELTIMFFKEIYTIKWRSTGTCTSNSNKQFLLASASNDIDLFHIMVEASKINEVYSFFSIPVVNQNPFPNCTSTVKLWDVELARPLHSLNSYREPVYTIAFSLNDEYLTSGSLDKCMNIWSVKEAKVVRTYNGNKQQHTQLNPTSVVWEG